MSNEAVEALLRCVPGPWDTHITRLAHLYVASFHERVSEGEIEYHDLQVVSADDEAIFDAVEALLDCAPQCRPSTVRLAVETVLEFANEFRSDTGARDVWVDRMYCDYLAYSGLEKDFDGIDFITAA